MSISAGSVPVVVIGAGPVGLMLAGELGRTGVPTVVVERLARPMTESRASQLTTRTAELLHERGCDPLLDEAAHEPRAHFAGIGIDLGVVDSDFAGHWKVPQYRTEAVLAERAEHHGVQVRRGHRLVGLTRRPGHVDCEIRRTDGTRTTVTAQYVVGCDGTDSTVRRLAGFTVAATAPTRELLRADVAGLHIRDRRFERLTAGFAVAATRDGVTRVMVHALGRGVTPRPGPPSFDEFAAVWRQVTGEDIGHGRPVWVDAFDNASGHARAYRLGRVLVAGDAAHWHLPIGGQALNVGLQDAADLGGRLARAVREALPPEVLDGYHDARHPVGARVLDWVAAQESLLLGGPGYDPLHAVLRELVGLPQAQAYLAGVVSDVGDRGPETPNRQSLRERRPADALV